MKDNIYVKNKRKIRGGGSISTNEDPFGGIGKKGLDDLAPLNL